MFGDLAEKGQSAIEYLMTYGWMLLVVSIAGGAIFATVQEPSGIEGTGDLSSDRLQVNDYSLSDENGLQIQLRSSNSETISVNNITVEDTETGIKSAVDPEEDISPADSKIYTVENARRGDSDRTAELNVNYDQGSLNDLEAETTIEGSVELYNELELTDLRPDESEDKIFYDIENAGSNPSGEISYDLETDSSQISNQISSLEPGESRELNETVSDLEEVQSIDLEADGLGFENRSDQLECRVDGGPVAHWNFENEASGDGGTLVDRTGNGLNGTYNGGVETGENGVFESKAASFDGEDDYVKVDHDELLNIGNTDELTISAWFKPAEFETNFGGLVTKNRDTQYESWYGTWAKDDSFNSRAGTLNTNDGEFGELEKWHHGVATINVSGNKTGFIDNEQINTVDLSSATITDRSGSLIIGASTATSEADDEHFYGSLDEIRIYNRSISDQEIDALYNENIETPYCRIE